MQVARALPTRRHRLAIVPGFLGTCYGVNREGEARYFDYDTDAAYAFAGIPEAAEIRLSRPTSAAQWVRSGAKECNPSTRTACLWVLDRK